MRQSKICYALLCSTIALAATAALAQSKFDFGKREYESNCASCHGIKGKGDGPYKPYLQAIAADLTVLAKKNGGVFPFARVYEVIDGRNEVKFHGPRDMPVWGADYLVKSAEYYADVPYDPELFVRTRIVALVDYINRLQIK